MICTIKTKNWTRPTFGKNGFIKSTLDLIYLAVKSWWSNDMKEAFPSVAWVEFLAKKTSDLEMTKSKRKHALECYIVGKEKIRFAVDLFC